jgi:mannan endo-1,4-beta-mannosidase
VAATAASTAPVAGVNFWAWSGEGRPREAGGAWKPGDPWVGDPPHEPQGWYGVYDADAGTLAVIKAAAAKLH